MTPSPMRIMFITDGEPFHGGSPEVQALGGSETALVQIARALAERGHAVEVFCRCPEPGNYRGVTYRDRRDLVKVAPRRRYDVAVVSRFFRALDLPLQAGLKVLWNHDILDRPEDLAVRLGRVDLMLVLSRFHAQDYLRGLPACSPKLALTRNGLDLDLIYEAAAGVARVPGRFTYVSRPERGLRLLLGQIWPNVMQAVPNAELRLCGYQVSDTPLSPGLRREYDEINQMVAGDGSVVMLGALAKVEYYRHLASCEALLYPCVFPEISCIAALEAQAVGTAVVTSDAFALAETVAVPAFRVPGEPGSPGYVDAFVERTMEVHENAPRTAGLTAQARAAVAASHDWRVIAAEWEELFGRKQYERLEGESRSIAAALLLNGATDAAEELLGGQANLPAEGPAPLDPDEAGLSQEIKQLLEDGDGLPAMPRVGVWDASGGVTARGLAESWPGASVTPFDSTAIYDVVVLRDVLERSANPAGLLARAAHACAPGGRLVLCVASGAWPLKHPGHLARRLDLGREDLAQMLAGREVSFKYLPRGLVNSGDESYFLGRWLALTPSAGPAPHDPDPEAALRRARPASPAILEEVLRAGIM